MFEKEYFVYILASEFYGTLYTGVTCDLIRRVTEHKESIKSFTQKHTVHRLVYFEVYGDINDAIEREKQIKKWRRDWKINLIEEDNPQWLDLYCEVE